MLQSLIVGVDSLLVLGVVTELLVFQKLHDCPDVEQVEVDITRVWSLHASLLQVRSLRVQQYTVPLVEMPLLFQNFPFRPDLAVVDELVIVLFSVRVVGLHEMACRNLNRVLLSHHDQTLLMVCSFD